MKKDIDIILQNHPRNQRDILIPILHEVQEELGYLTEEAIVKISHHLNLPTSKVYSVATFYDNFKFEVKGKNHIKICKGSACHVYGASTLIQEIERILKIKPGQTTRDKMFSIEIVSCIGACAMSPVIFVNDVAYPKVTIEKIKEIITLCIEKV